MSVGLGPLRRPIRIVLQWQAIATVVLALAGGFLAGVDGALSAICGGAVSMVAGAVSAVVAARGKARSAGGVLIGALRGEATRIGLMALLLWLVLTTYEHVVPPALFGSFLVTVLIFTMAFFVREQD
jgi:ATP synthase protein I